MYLLLGAVSSVVITARQLSGKTRLKSDRSVELDIQPYLFSHTFALTKCMILTCVICCVDDRGPRTATNPEYFASDKSMSKPPHNDYYNAPTAAAPAATAAATKPGAGISRTGSRFNESRV